MKSRTVLGRTISKVKSRISSLGSLVSNSDSPDPFLAPPAPLDSPTAATLTLPIQDATRQAQSTNLDGPTTPHAASLPPIAALKITIESWTVFNAHPRYHTAAYVKFDVSCIIHNAIASLPLSAHFNPGQLLDLSLELQLIGPAVTLTHYGNLTTPTLNPSDHWVNVIHIGIKDTSLASKLSTSLRSLGKSASRSASRFGRYTNIDLINRWLSVLESEDPYASIREPVRVHAVVKFKHSLFPETTMLESAATCKVKMTKEEMERADITGVRLDSMKESADDEDDYEERVREARVLGAPWL